MICFERINFTHVHGHKDEKIPFVDLTVVEKLNVLCDEGAKEVLHMTDDERARMESTEN